MLHEQNNIDVIRYYFYLNLWHTIIRSCNYVTLTTTVILPPPARTQPAARLFNIVAQPVICVMTGAANETKNTGTLWNTVVIVESTKYEFRAHIKTYDWRTMALETVIVNIGQVIKQIT